MQAGIYSITNTANGKSYIGSSRCVPDRFRSHKYFLWRGSHHSVKLQRAWDKYGADSFTFELLLTCREDDLLDYEQRCIDGFKSVDDGYNMLPTAGSRLGSKHSDEVLATMKSFQRSNRKKYEWKGKEMCLYEIAELEGLPGKVVERRVNEYGWSLDDAVSKPVGKHGFMHPGKGKNQTFQQWVDEIGCTDSFLRLWLGRGLTIEQCIEKHKRITVSEFARLSGVDPNMFAARIRAGWCAGKALALPVNPPNCPKPRRKTQ